MALLVGAVSAEVWFCYVWGWGTLLRVILVCIVVGYAALIVAALIPLPSVLVCDRAAPNIEADISTTRTHGYFVKRHVLGCTLYTHKSRTPPGITYDGGGIYSH